MASQLPLSFNQTVRGIAEFLEVAIHNILYVRQVYPVDLFMRRKKYNTAVFQSRHPALNEYISGAVKAASEEMTLGHVEKIVVVIKDREDRPLERFIFAIRNMIEVEPFNKDTSVEEAITPDSLGKYFRSFLVKLSMVESQLGHLDAGDDLSFAVVLELQERQAPSATQGKDPPPWVPAVPHHTTARVSDTAQLHMLRAVDTGVINLSLAVQESELKLIVNKEQDIEDKGKQRAA